MKSRIFALANTFLMKKILNVHGFASSGQSGTAAWLRKTFPGAEILSPDIPVDPHEGLALLTELVAAEAPDLIVGTSMGGMYAEMLHGTRRILVNPAFEIADTLRSRIGTGRHVFYNARQDGATDFMVTKGLIEAYREVASRCFEHAADEGEDKLVWGLFGTHDELVHTFPIFRQHYTRAVHFEGGHHLDDHARIHALLPVVRWADDEIEGRQRPVLFVALEDTLMKPDGTVLGSAPNAFARLAATYDAYVVARADWYDDAHAARCRQWVEQHLGVPAYNRLVVTPRPEQLLGDYFVSAAPVDGFIGIHIPYATPEFREWQHVLTYFERLGGQ